MDIISELKTKNPGLPLFSVYDSEFAPYGRILGEGNGETLELMKGTSVPETGNTYVASDKSLEANALIREIGKRVYGGMAWMAGYCNGHGHVLNAFEYHKCSEVNYTDTGLVLLLALPGQLKDGFIDSSELKAFYLPANVFVEIHPLVMHFAPCRVNEDCFRCLVVLEEGTNSPVELPGKDAAGEYKLLWMKNKWLTCHKDSPQAAKGAFVGITGENTVLNI